MGIIVCFQYYEINFQSIQLIGIPKKLSNNNEAQYIPLDRTD